MVKPSSGTKPKIWSAALLVAFTTVVLSACATDAAEQGELVGPPEPAPCSRISEIYSALFNADTGYTQYSAFGVEEWASRVDAASAELAHLANSAESSLHEAFIRMSAAVSDPNRVVGSAVTTAAAQEPLGEIGETCAVNQTPVTIQAEFGG